MRPHVERGSLSAELEADSRRLALPVGTHLALVDPYMRYTQDNPSANTLCLRCDNPQAVRVMESKGQWARALGGVFHEEVSDRDSEPDSEGEVAAGSGPAWPVALASAGNMTIPAHPSTHTHASLWQLDASDAERELCEQPTKVLLDKCTQHFGVGLYRQALPYAMAAHLRCLAGIAAASESCPEAATPGDLERSMELHTDMLQTFGLLATCTFGMGRYEHAVEHCLKVCPTSWVMTA
jgi:hypothetical protein